MRLWRFLTKPVPPATTVEGARFTLGWLLTVSGIAFATGIIYAAGIVGDEGTLGLLFIAASIGSLYPCWRIVCALRRLRDKEGKQRPR